MNIEETAAAMSKLIEKIKKGVQDNSYPNESSISRQVVEPILKGLGWPTDDPDVVKYELQLKGKRADIALLHKEQSKVIIEVKRLGAADEAAREQLFEYCYHAGVAFAVLTTGREWEFYLPMLQGAYQDRQVYKLDICARETEESVRRLMNYLFHPDVCSGTSDERAKADHGDKTRAKKIHDALPQAWGKVLSECDERLIELLKDKVGDICGFTPEAEVVRTFIQEQAGDEVPTQPSPSKTIESKNSKPRQKLKGFELRGIKHDASTAIDIFVDVFKAFIELDASFPDKFMQIRHGTSNRWLSGNRLSLYPNKDESYCITHSRPLSAKYWIGTNYHAEEKKKIIKSACEVAGFQYGKDFKLLWIDG